MFQKQTPLLVAINIVLIVLLYYLTKPALANRELSKNKRALVIVFSFVFCIFSFWGADWFHYLDLFESIKKNGATTNLEDVYYWIIERCSNYWMYRIIVWGGALFFYIRTLKLLNININIVLFFFCSIYLIWFSYTRATLAMSLMFYGATLIITNDRKTIIRFVAGLFFIGVSYYFHKSSLLGIATIFFAMLLHRRARTSTIIALILYPLIVYLFSRFLGAGVELMLSDEDSTLGIYASRGNMYLESSGGSQGLGVQVVSFFEKIPYYLLAVLCFLEIYGKKQLIKNSAFFYYLTIILVLVSSIFLFDINVNGSVAYVRFLRYTQIPASISLAYLFDNNRYPQMYKCTYILGVIGCFVNMSYVFYCVFITFH